MVRRNTSPRRLAHMRGEAARTVVECLESRTLLSGTSERGAIIATQWDGREIRARAGEWIVCLEAPTEEFDADGALVSTTRKWNWGTRPNAEIEQAMSRLAADGIEFVEYGGSEDVFLISAPPTLGASEVAARVRNIPGFVSVVPNGVGRLAALPNDGAFPLQYALNNTGQAYALDSEGDPISGTADADIDAPEAWELTTGSASVVVAVLDTGINHSHPDLEANIFNNSREV